jgi:hypothetical protein
MRETIGKYWRWIALFFIAMVPRLYLLHVFDIELSNDGFDAVKTLSILQIQGPSAVPRELIDRFLLHPLYMMLLGALRIVVPSGFDLYIPARFMSALIACIGVVILFEFTRHSYGEGAAWMSAILLAFAPTFLWESVAILSSTLFLLLYIGTLFALTQSRYRLAAALAFLAAITRYEGIVLLALVFIGLAVRDLRARRMEYRDWLAWLGCLLATPLTLMASGWIAVNSPFEFAGANSMAAIWLAILAPGDFAKRASFFITQYPALFPMPVVILGVAGGILAVIRHRVRATGLLILAAAAYLLFFEALVWLNLTTLEVRFLMYPGLPLLIFAGVALVDLYEWLGRSKPLDLVRNAAVGLVVIALAVMSFQQGVAGMQFIYNSYAAQREVADELAHIVPPSEPTNVMLYAGVAGALDLFARPLGLRLNFTDFRNAPDDQPEQFLLARKIRFVIYPVGNPFARAKFPYLSRFETQTHGAATFQPLTQFSTSTDKQLWSIWAVTF